MQNLSEVSWITEWYYVHLFWGLYWELKVTVSMCQNDAWWIQSEVSGMCPLICWHMQYAHASSKVKEWLCVNGYQWYTWWCAKWLLSFKVSPSNHLGMVQLVKMLNLTTDHMFLSCALDLVVSNDSDAGTVSDCVCCFCPLSIHVGFLSIHRTWFSWGLTIGCQALPLHL